MSRAARAGAFALAAGCAAGLELARGHSDWGPSEGVYAMSARLFAEGGDLYGELVASQPPWLYLFGAGALLVHDSLDFLRAACGVLTVATALLASEAVWRLTASRAAAVVAAPAVVLTPWAVHQHGLLLPEAIGAPLLLGAALAASRPAGARWAGIAAGVAPFVKLPFLLPAVAVLLFSADRTRAVRWAAVTALVQALAFTAVFGTGFWEQIVVAQAQAGKPLNDAIGPWVQLAWNIGPLVLLAALALRWRSQARDPELLRVLAALAAALLLTLVSIAKPGTGLNVAVPAEALLVPLAVAGVLFAVRRRPALALVPALAALFLLAQSASLLADPENPRPFHRIGSSSPGWRVLRTDDQMRAEVERLRACPEGTVYAGPPLVAFIADRRIPADQPDDFILRADVHEDVRARKRADGPGCP